MKEPVTTLTERGQVSVPAAVRKRMQLEPGAKLRWLDVSGHECRVVVERKDPPAGAVAMCGYATTFRKKRRTREWMREIRDGERD